MNEDKRIYFKECEVRKQFFREVRTAYNAKSWKELAKMLQLHRTFFQKYQYGQSTMPENLFNRLVSKLENEKQEYFIKNISKKDVNWGCVKGGKITFAKYPEEFARRRKKGLRKIIKMSKQQAPKYDFNINQSLSEKLCEFIGAFIGDGCINKYGRHYSIRICGDSLYDNNYLTEHMPKYTKVLFDQKGYNYFAKNANSVELRFHSKKLFKLITERFEFPKGVKSYTVKIPEEIIKSEKKLIFATVRGIFDTDGCVFLDKRKAYKKPYPRITLQTVSKPLYLQLKEILSKEFSLYTYENKKRNSHYVEVYGHLQIAKWMKLIGFSNERHLSKIRALGAI